MPDWLHGLIQGHATWLVAVVIGLESMGLPLPGETALVGAAIYAATTGGLAIETVVLWAAVGAIVGDNIGYLIGRQLGRRALERYGAKIGLTSDRLLLSEYLFHRHGPKIVFLGRFIALLRAAAALIAGAMLMPWPRFLLWNALGGITWTALYGFGAYWLGNHIHKFIGPIGLVLGPAALVFLVWLFFFIRRNEHRLIEEAKAARRQPALAASPSSSQV